MPTEDAWNESALNELTTREPVPILKASVQMIGLLKSRGILPPGELRQSLLDLPNHSGEELESRSSRISLQLIEVLTDSQAPPPPPPLPPLRTVPAQEVFDYVRRHNPFFQRWLEFRDARPARHPEEWEQFAIQNVPSDRHDYAIAMREFGQILTDFIQERRTLDPEVASRLKLSHQFVGREMGLSLLAWLDIAEQEG